LIKFPRSNCSEILVNAVIYLSYAVSKLTSFGQEVMQDMVSVEEDSFKHSHLWTLLNLFIFGIFAVITLAIRSKAIVNRSQKLSRHSRPKICVVNTKCAVWLWKNIR